MIKNGREFCDTCGGQVKHCEVCNKVLARDPWQGAVCKRCARILQRAKAKAVAEVRAKLGGLR